MKFIGLFLTCAIAAQAWTTPEHAADSASAELDFLIETLSKYIDVDELSAAAVAPVPARSRWAGVMTDLRAVLRKIDKVDDGAATGHRILQAIQTAKREQGHKRRSTNPNTAARAETHHRGNCKQPLYENGTPVDVMVLDAGQKVSDEWMPAVVDTVSHDGKYSLQTVHGSPIVAALSSGIQEHHLRPHNKAELSERVALQGSKRYNHFKASRMGLGVLDPEEVEKEDQFSQAFSGSRLQKRERMVELDANNRPAGCGCKGSGCKSKINWRKFAVRLAEAFKSATTGELRGGGHKSPEGGACSKGLSNSSNSTQVNSTRVNQNKTENIKKNKGCGFKSRTNRVMDANKTATKYNCNATGAYAPGTLVDVMVLDAGQKVSDEWMPAVVDTVSCDGKYSLRKPYSHTPVRAALSSGIQEHHLRLPGQDAEQAHNNSPQRSRWLHNQTSTKGEAQDPTSLQLIEQVKKAEQRLQAAKQALQDERRQKATQSAKRELAEAQEAAEAKAAGEAKAAAEAKAASKIAEIDDEMRQAKLRYEQLEALRTRLQF